ASATHASARSTGQGPLSATKRDSESRAPRDPATSVGADRPEAVGAVDRPVHARTERHLRLVAAGGADDREVLPVGTIDASLVAAWPADVTDVVAAVARRTS